MRLSIAIVGLALLYASSSFAGATGNGWTQNQAAAPAHQDQRPQMVRDDQHDDHHDDAGCRDSHGKFAKCGDHHEAPAGATAMCRDGTYSMSHHHSGTCSHHRGVAHWIK